MNLSYAPFSYKPALHSKESRLAKEDGQEMESNSWGLTNAGHTRPAKRLQNATT